MTPSIVLRRAIGLDAGQRTVIIELEDETKASTSNRTTADVRTGKKYCECGDQALVFGWKDDCLELMHPNVLWLLSIVTS